MHPGVFGFGAIACLLITACDQLGSTEIDTLLVNEGPMTFEYGPQQELYGVWLAEFEGSSFNYCPPEAPGCPEGMFDNWGCWLAFAEPAQEQLRAAIPGDQEWYDIEGTFTIGFTGRETLRRGMYGHLGISSCQILVEDLHHVQAFEPEREDSRMARLLGDQNEHATPK